MTECPPAHRIGPPPIDRNSRLEQSATHEPAGSGPWPPGGPASAAQFIPFRAPRTIMNTLLQALAELPHSGESNRSLDRLAELMDGELPLQDFLEQLLPPLCRLYGASAAVVWLKSQDAVFGVRYGMDDLLAGVAQQKHHERLVQFVWQQQRAMLVEPAQASAEADMASTSNPTQRRLLFGPVLHLNEPIALLEIVLAADSAPASASQKQRYLRSIQLLAAKVYSGLKPRMIMPAAPWSRAREELARLTADLQTIKHQLQTAIEHRLTQFQGWSFGSLADNQEFAKSVQAILEAHGLRVLCTECGQPAILRCLRAGNSKHGVFVFDHYLDKGRTFHGGPASIPLLKVVAKPPRRGAVRPSEPAPGMGATYGPSG